MATIALEPTIQRDCRRCDGTFTRDQLVKSRRHPTGLDALCLGCDRKRKRRAEHGPDLGWKEVDMAPDRRVAARVRGKLTRLRELDYPWERAWPAAIQYAIADVSQHDADGWRAAFAATASTWHAAFVRSEQPFTGCAPLTLD